MKQLGGLKNNKMMNREQPGLNIDFNQTTAEICEECGNDTFVQVFKMRKLSALLSPTGQESMIPFKFLLVLNVVM